MQRNVAERRQAFAWPRVVAPLERLAGLAGGVQPRSSAIATARYGVVAMQELLLRRGLLDGVREGYRVLRRSSVP